MVAIFHRHGFGRIAVVSITAIIALGLLTYGGFGLWQRYHATHNPPSVITKTVITHSTDTPNETKPDDACAKYKVDSAYPERIDILAINTGGCITRVGIDQYDAIAVPDNIYTAAWYVKSALPGQPGLSVIDGHVSGRYNTDAIFQNLGRLKKGDEFTITLGSGRVLRYSVFKQQSVPLNIAVNVLLAKDPQAFSQLNLVTCGGNYDRATKLYDHRVIVSAELL